VANGKVYGVDTKVRDLCPDGSFLRVQENAFKFFARAGTRTQPAIISGKRLRPVPGQRHLEGHPPLSLR
jgi:hypothetical protein